MRINSVLKVNRLEGHDIRGDFRAHATLGDADRIAKYVAQEGIQRLVLLEDFVGSGNQMRSTADWAAMTLPNIQILLVPLICCPDGIVTGQELAAEHSNLIFAPTLVLEKALFLLPKAQQAEPALFPKLRSVVIRLRDRMGRWQRHPFGYEDTGAIIVLYTNCPDNSLALIHDDSDTWEALFPRVQRG